MMNIARLVFNVKLILMLFVIAASCDNAPKSKDKAEATKETVVESGGEVAPSETENSWISEEEAGSLSNTWVDEEDKGELSNTWAEDAFGEELSGSGSTNSWVDADGETIYKNTEVPPEFVGGKDALFEYMGKNIVYPEEVQYGSVYVAFVVTKTGEIRDIRVVKGINEGCDKEAIRLIKNMPKWDPGMEKGQLVSSVYGLPVIFRPR